MVNISLSRLQLFPASQAKHVAIHSHLGVIVARTHRTPWLWMIARAIRCTPSHSKKTKRSVNITFRPTQFTHVACVFTRVACVFTRRDQPRKYFRLSSVAHNGGTTTTSIAPVNCVARVTRRSQRTSTQTGTTPLSHTPPSPNHGVVRGLAVV